MKITATPRMLYALMWLEVVGVLTALAKLDTQEMESPATVCTKYSQLNALH